VLDKAEYSAFESTLNSPIVSYRIAVHVTPDRQLTNYNTSTCWSSLLMKHHWCSWSRCRSTKTYTDCLSGFYMPSNFSARGARFLSVVCSLDHTVLGWLIAYLS